MRTNNTLGRVDFVEGNGVGVSGCVEWAGVLVVYDGKRFSGS